MCASCTVSLNKTCCFATYVCFSNFFPPTHKHLVKAGTISNTVSSDIAKNRHTPEGEGLGLTLRYFVLCHWDSCRVVVYLNHPLHSFAQLLTSTERLRKLRLLFLKSQLHHSSKNLVGKWRCGPQRLGFGCFSLGLA